MCNLKQTPQSNWWSNDSTPLYDTMGLGMLLRARQPWERGVETSWLLPSRGTLQYLPFLLSDELPVALESSQLKALAPPEGLAGGSQASPTSPRLSHVEPPAGEDGGCSSLQQGLVHAASSAMGKRHRDTLSSLPLYQRGRDWHPMPHLRGLLPPPRIETQPAPAGPREMARSPPRASSGVGCWLRFKTLALSWSLSIRVNVSPLLCPFSTPALTMAPSAVSSSRGHTCAWHEGRNHL